MINHYDTDSRRIMTKFAGSRRFRAFSYALTIFCLVLCSIMPVSASTIHTKSPKGLLITPATQFATVNAGKTQAGDFGVANHTANPLTISFSIKQFTVDNYSYNYNFNPPNNNWIKISLPQVTLLPGQTQTVPYNINIPIGTQPGGNYFILLASATLTSGNLTSKVQAASLLYLTVNGKLTYTSRLVHDYIQRVMFGTQLAYHFSVIDTGNDYFFIYTSGALHGLSTKPAMTTPVTHLVIPGKIRQFTGTIPHPLLPGVYRATYGYTTDTGAVVQRSQLILYIPPWSIAVVLLVLLAGNVWYVKRKK